MELLIHVSTVTDFLLNDWRGTLIFSLFFITICFRSTKALEQKEEPNEIAEFAILIFSLITAAVFLINTGRLLFFSPV